MRRPIYAIDLKAGRKLLGHASTIKGAERVARKYTKLAGKVYLSAFNRYIAPVLDVND